MSHLKPHVLHFNYISQEIHIQIKICFLKYNFVCGMVDPGLVTASPNLLEEIYAKLIKTLKAPGEKLNKCPWTTGVYENWLMTLVRHVVLTHWKTAWGKQ